MIFFIDTTYLKEIAHVCVVLQAMKHLPTNAGLTKFLEDWRHTASN